MIWIMLDLIQCSICYQQEDNVYKLATKEHDFIYYPQVLYQRLNWIIIIIIIIIIIMIIIIIIKESQLIWANEVV